MKTGIILSLAGGYVLGKAGNFIFGSQTARKVYTQLATGALIAKDSIMESVEKIQAGAADITADAKENVERYYAQKGVVYDRGTDGTALEASEEE